MQRRRGPKVTATEVAEPGPLSTQTEALRRVAAERGAVLAAEHALAAAVAEARGLGASWEAVGTWLGLTGEGARRRYGRGREAPKG